MIQKRDIPNLLTLLRIVLVFPTGWCIMQGWFYWALALFFLAGVTDLADGYLARTYNWVTELGGILDPAADKVLMTVSYFAMAWQGLIPWWLFYVVVGRDIIIVGGALAYQLVTRSLTMEPLFISKLNTAAQILLILYMLWQSVFHWFPDWMNWLAIYGVLLTSLASGVMYVFEWGKRTQMFRQGR